MPDPLGPVAGATPRPPLVRTPALRFHPDRDRLFNELHNRPFPVLGDGARVSHWATIHEGHDADDEYRHIEALCLRYTVPPPPPGSSCHYQHFGGFEFRWERHNEFSTWMVIVQDPAVQPFAGAALGLLPEEWLAGVPGRIISAQHIDVIAHPDPAPVADDLRRYFEGHRLISSWIGEQQARLWTAWRIHADGFGRILVLNRDLNPCQSGRLVRALLEVETYRMMLLTAFPLARSIAPQVNDMAARLAGINAEINAIGGLDDERRLLQQLSTLAARTEHMIAESRYRFSAARAYHDLVISRLKDLREQEASGLQTVNEFLKRRLTPAFRTCQAVSTQLDDLSQRIDRTSELLRTRVNLTLEAQNQELLQSMDSRSQLQLQLQQAVEGLSVAAISYYLVGLVKYIAGALHSRGLITDTSLVAGFAVPVSLVVVWWGVHRLRRRLRTREAIAR